MGQKTERCENCGCIIGKLEQAYVHNGHVVCNNCNDKLTNKAEGNSLEQQNLSQLSNRKDMGPKRIPCPHCKELMDIDADRCPHCGKSGGFSYQYTMGWGFLGTIVGILINIWILSSGKEPVDIGTSAFCGACLCSPMFWIITLPAMCIGVIIGFIHASIDKNKVKKR